MRDFSTELLKVGIVPVVKIENSEDAAKLAQTLLNAGLSIVEITFRTKAAEASIREIAKHVPGMCICAGTILDVDTAKRAVDAGAQAIISPGINIDVIRWCNENDIPVIPGCATPTEIQRCMREGLKTVKLFPAEVIGGVKMLKALSGPYADMKFMPTGGISSENVMSYLTLKNVVACGGSWIVTEKLLAQRDFDKIYEIAHDAAQMVFTDGKIYG